jgi:multidrug efflux system outer membrane protein
MKKTICTYEKKRLLPSFSLIPMSLLSLLLVGMLALSLSSCNEGPNYKRPGLTVPQAFRSAGDFLKPDKEDVKEYLGDMFWWDFFQDDVLKDLIATSIVQNFDLKIASERIIEYQARVGVARASQFPTVGATGAMQTTKVSEVGPTPFLPGATNNTYSFNVGLMATYEADFWGKFSKATQAARADLLATEEGRYVTLMTLVSNMATAYMQLRTLDLEIEVSEKTLESRKESLDMVTARVEGGVATQLDLDQAKGLYIDAQKTITQIKQQILTQENTIAYLLGEPPRSIPRGKPLVEQFTTVPIPVGLPSSLLLNRPDIRKAEAQLFAANARIGAARALFFPQITLTGAGGTQSKELADLFSARSFYWNLAAGALQPIFNGGQIRSTVQVNESQMRQYALAYQSSVQNAFKEVSDGIINYQLGAVYVKQQTEYRDTLADQSYLAKLRYEGGVSSYLEVLDTERQYFNAELDLARAQGTLVDNIIYLYKALGGGWKEKPGAEPSPSGTPQPPATAAPSTAVSPSATASPAATPLPSQP